MKRFLVFMQMPVILFAHGVTTGDQGYIQEINGVNFFPFMYLGAKHMVTGYDHLLFLVGVIFFLYRLKDIGIYVSLFAVGHSSTLLLGVFADKVGLSYLTPEIGEIVSKNKLNRRFTPWWERY